MKAEPVPLLPGCSCGQKGGGCEELLSIFWSRGESALSARHTSTTPAWCALNTHLQSQSMKKVQMWFVRQSGAETQADWEAACDWGPAAPLGLHLKDIDLMLALTRPAF